MSGKSFSRGNKGNGKDSNQKRKARKSTGGEAPRKMLCEKGKRYFYERQDGEIREMETQTYPSTSDQQTQAAAGQHGASSQTDFNSRFYIERTDRLARETLARQQQCSCRCQCGAMDDSDSD